MTKEEAVKETEVKKVESKSVAPAAAKPAVEKKEEGTRPPSRPVRPDRESRPRSPQQRRSSPRRFYRRRQKQIVPAYVDWKDVEYLQRFIPERGKIMPRRISGVSAKDQRRIARAIKRARVMALLPYVAD